MCLIIKIGSFKAVESTILLKWQTIAITTILI